DAAPRQGVRRCLGRPATRDLRRHLLRAAREAGVRGPGQVLRALPRPRGRRLLHHARRHARPAVRGQRAARIFRRPACRGAGPRWSLLMTHVSLKQEAAATTTATATAMPIATTAATPGVAAHGAAVARGRTRAGRAAALLAVATACGAAAAAEPNTLTPAE